MENNPFFDPPKPQKRNWLALILEILAGLTLLLLIGWIILLEQNQVNGPSMQPNYYTGEFLLTNRLPKFIGNTPFGKTFNIDYQRGDVVILQKPGYEDFVKRVIALPGEKISINNGKIFINGNQLIEDYLAADLYTNGGDFITEGGAEIEVPSGHYILIGDNRPQSNDSRFSDIGFIKREWIKGKVLVRIWPLSVFSFIPQGKYSFQ